MKKLSLIICFLLLGLVSADAQYGPIRFPSSGGTFTGGTLTSNLTMSNGALIGLEAGSQSNLPLRFKGDIDTGLFSSASDTIRFVTGNIVSGILGPAAGITAYGFSHQVTGSVLTLFGAYTGAGNYGVAVGYSTGRGMTGESNVALGTGAGDQSGTWVGHSKSIAIGRNAMNVTGQATATTNCIAVGFETYTTASNQAVIGDANVKDFQLGQGGTVARFASVSRILSDSVECIRVASSGTQIFQYTKLGDEAPALKCKLLTGTTPSEVASTTNIAHGLTSSKIVSYSCVLNHAANVGMDSTWGIVKEPPYTYSALFDTSDFLVFVATSSTSILSKPIQILVWYTE